MKGLTFVVLSFLAVPLSAIPDLQQSPADGVVQDKSLKPGLVGQYWNFGKEMNKFPEEFVKAHKPDLCRIDGVIDFDSKEERGFKEGRGGDLPWKDYFAVVWTGVIRLPMEGDYTFYLKSHDSSKLFLNGNLVIDHDGTHPLKETSSKTVHMKAGDQDLKIEYFHNKGGSCLLSWTYDNVEKQIVPATALWHKFDKEVDREAK